MIIYYIFCYFLTHRRESWPLFSSYSCWQQLVSQTKTLSKDHAALSEVYSTHIVSRLQQVIEDVQRIYKRVRIVVFPASSAAKTINNRLFVVFFRIIFSVAKSD